MTTTETHYHGKEPCAIHHGQEFVDRDKAARERLPQALAELKRTERELAEAKARVEACQTELKMLVGDIITNHEKHGEIGVTTMASGALVYWIPENLGV
jgi:hypothetical protein